MNITYQKSIDVRYDVDVFIAGGGPAGVAAAVSCARQGRSVFIAEGFSAFGGAAVTMLVPAFMTFGDGINFLAAGIGSEVYDKLKADAFPRWKRYCPMCIPAETLKLLYDDMVDESGAKYMFHCNVIDTVVENGEIQYVICSAKGSVFAVHANIYIDCTGDGDLASYAGAECEFGDEQGRTMATTLCGIWTGVDWSRVKGPDSRRLEDAFKDHIFVNEDRHLPGMWRLMEETANADGTHNADGVGGSNAGHVYDVDARDAASLTKGIVRGRHQLLEYRRYYKEYLDGYENAEMVASAPYLGIRESRRVLCDYKLVLDDFKRQATFDDEIGRYSYNIDIHSPTNDNAGYDKFITEHTSFRYKQGESYGIPYRALAVKGLTNLLVAGRCISTDRHMQSSVRVMPGCYITGQAAGIAAAVVCDAHGKDVHNVDVHEIQSRLAKMGAYLPNFKA
ncbi:MAG: FAD-dependent oxidoreductase [Clostridia bacterium]|nr:FAD-dependent oxidoreductase [Clostridia bacterium]